MDLISQEAVRVMKPILYELSEYKEYKVGVFWYQVCQAKFQERLLNCEAWRAIQHAFKKPSLVNLISKDVNLLF